MATSAGRKNLNKNAISAFEEYGVHKRLAPKVEIVRESGPPHKPVFEAVAKLGEKEICNQQGHSKHEARIRAAERALQMLSIQDHNNSNGDTNNIKVECNDVEFSNPVPYKDPVSALMEYSQYTKQEVTFDLVSQEGPPHMPIFTMVVKLGERKFNPVSGSSSRESKKRAACVALNSLKSDGLLNALFPDTKITGMPAGKLKSKSSLGIPGKNPVSILNEYAQKKSLRLTFDSSQSGPPHKPQFTVWAVLGEECFPAVTASNKKEGNAQAAQIALDKLKEQGIHLNDTQTSNQNHMFTRSNYSPTTHHDKVAQASLLKVDELLLQTPQQLVGRKVVAAIVMYDQNQDMYRVVSVGSGNRCIKGSNITDDGTVIHDSHAEVLARRGFKRFIYWLLANQSSLPILERCSDRKWRFKNGISFHLYISTAPCGDGALFTHSDQRSESCNCVGTEHNPTFTNSKTQGLLRAKQENGEGTIPIEAEFVVQTYDGIKQGGRLRIMSCSDKICQWNVLGIQGALLSNIIEPVYLQSITLGHLYNAGNLARALCCRLQYDKQNIKLPNGYYIQHPDLGLASNQDSSRAVEKARSLSINWCFGDSSPEITDGTTGKTVKFVNRVEAPSRLCKKQLLDLYKHIVNDGRLEQMFYKQIKLQCDDYNMAKKELRDRFIQQKFGSWVCMPREVDRFQ
ncbi:hypothetical protein ACF0H5_018452 [Mactra antiquata]